MRWYPPLPPAVPAQLLDAAYAATPFTGREPMLDQLSAWCRTGAALSGRLLVAPAGHGKTRLAREFADRLYRGGWLVGELSSAPPEERWLRHLERTDRPVLLIVDPAENRQEAAGRIAEHLADHPPRAVVRLLLLARDGGQWWRMWRARVPDAARAFLAEPITLDGIEGPREPVEPLLRDTMVSWTARAEALPAIVRPLSMDALLVAALAGPVNRAEALRALAALPRAGSEQDRESLVDWLADLSSMREAQYNGWGEILPGPLREHFAATAFAHPDVLAVVPRLNPDHAEAALGALACAAAPDALAALVHKHLPELWQPAVRAACHVETPTPLVEALHSVLSGPEVSSALCEAVQRALPSPADRLQPVAVSVAGRLVRERRRDLDEGRDSTGYPLAAQLVVESAILAEDADPEPALSAAREAVRLYQQRMSVDPPEVALPGLCQALRATAQRLAEAHQPAQAVAPAEEAVAHWRSLATGDASRTGALASALDFLAGLRLAAGQAKPAATAFEEAAELYRDLRPERRVLALCGLSDALAAAGQFAAAASALDNAVDGYERLANDRPQTYLHPLAATCEVLAERWHRAGELRAAVAAGQRAVRYYGHIADHFPGGELPDRAEALRRLSDLLAEAEQPHAALEMARQSLRLYEALSPRAESPLQPRRSAAAFTLSSRHAELGDLASAVWYGTEAVNGYRGLTDQRRGEHRRALVAALGTLALHKGMQGRLVESAPLAREAVVVAGQLAEEGDPLPGGAALTNQAIVLGEIGHSKGEGAAELPAAVESARKAVELLSACRDGDDRVMLAKALDTLALRLAAAGDVRAAVGEAEQAVRVLGEPATDASEDELRRYAVALYTLTDLHVQAQDWADAMTTARRTYEAFRRLPEPRSLVDRADLAAVSALVSRLPEEAVPTETALAAAREAVADYTALEMQDSSRYREPRAAALGTLAALFDRVDASAASRTERDKEIEVRRALAGDHSAQHVADLATALLHKATSLEDRTLADAVAAAEEAYALSQRVHHPRLGLATLADSAYTLSRLLTKPGPTADDLRSVELAATAVSRYERLADADAPAYLARYAAALVHRSRRYWAVNNWTNAIADAEKALQHYRLLATNRPQHVPALIEALMHYASVVRTDRPGELRRIYHEVNEHYQRLADVEPDAYGEAYARALRMEGNTYDTDSRRPRPESLELHEKAAQVLEGLAVLRRERAESQGAGRIATRIEADNARDEAAKEWRGLAERLERAGDRRRAREARSRAERLEQDQRDPG